MAASEEFSAWGLRGCPFGVACEMTEFWAFGLASSRRRQPSVRYGYHSSLFFWRKPALELTLGFERASRRGQIIAKKGATYETPQA